MIKTIEKDWSPWHIVRSHRDAFGAKIFKENEGEIFWTNFVAFPIAFRREKLHTFFVHKLQTKEIEGEFSTEIFLKLYDASSPLRPPLHIPEDRSASPEGEFIAFTFIFSWQWKLVF